MWGEFVLPDVSETRTASPARRASPAAAEILAKQRTAVKMRSARRPTTTRSASAPEDISDIRLTAASKLSVQATRTAPLIGLARTACALIPAPCQTPVDEMLSAASGITSPNVLAHLDTLAIRQSGVLMTRTTASGTHAAEMPSAPIWLEHLSAGI